MIDSIYNIRILVMPDKPKMQLSPEVMVPDHFRREINEWMIEFFGMENMIDDGHVMYMELSNTFLVNPRTYAAIQQHGPDKFFRGLDETYPAHPG